MAELGGELPDGVMREILSRLPPESLLRFKSVSKSWYALINDPKFCCSLLHNPNVVLLKRTTYNEAGEGKSRFSFLKYPFPVAADDDDTSLEVEVEVEVEDVHFPSFGDFRDNRTYVRFVCHSHGLVCLIPDFEIIFMYNPVTKELRKLPPSILCISQPQDPYDSDSDSDSDLDLDLDLDRVQSLPGGIGFGCDLKSMDFKVVRIVDFVPPGTDLHDYYSEPTYLPSRVEVFDLKKDEWREIETTVPGRVKPGWWQSAWWVSSFQLYYQGFYYWLANSLQLGVSTHIIMWFDMTQEVFGQSPLPESFHSEFWDVSIQLLNGSIFLIPPLNDINSLDVWEMVKLGDGVVSWSKLFTISSLVCQTLTVLAFVDSNQLLMNNEDGQLILYNVKTQHSKHLHLLLDEEDNNPREFQATVFVKTLLSVNVNGGCKYI